MIGDTCFALIFYEDEQNNIYMTREQIGKALEYQNERQISIIHARNQNDLDDMSVEISMFENVHQTDVGLSNPDSKPLSELRPNTLLYNEDGIYEITFLSRQPKANEFRAWVRERIKEIRKGTIRIQC